MFSKLIKKLNTNEEIPNKTRIKIAHACSSTSMKTINSIPKLIRGNVNYKSKTKELLINHPHYRDIFGNSILQLLLKNGNFDKDLLIELITCGHDINHINYAGIGILGSVSHLTYDILEKWEWLLVNTEINSIINTKDNNGKWIPNKMKSTTYILNYCSFLIFQHIIIPENIKTEDKQISEDSETKYTSKTYLDKLIKIFTLLIDKDLILNDLTKDSEFKYYNPILIFMNVEHIKKCESVLKFNWNVEDITINSYLSYSKQQPKYYIRRSDIDNARFNCNTIKELIDYTLSKVKNPSKLINNMIKELKLLKLRFDNMIKEVKDDEPYYDDDDDDEYLYDIDRYTYYIELTQNMVSYLETINN